MSLISRYSRSIVALGAAGLTGVALAACSPALENPSPEKIETATEQDADSVGVELAATGTETAASATTAAVADVAFIDCVGMPEQQPEQVTLDCTNPADAVVGITWSEWGEDQAAGTGTNQSTGAVSEVVLSSPAETGQGMVFTDITVDGTPVVQ